MRACLDRQSEPVGIIFVAVGRIWILFWANFVWTATSHHLRAQRLWRNMFAQTGPNTNISPEHDVKLPSHLVRIILLFAWWDFQLCGRLFAGHWSSSILRDQLFVCAVDDFSTYTPAVQGITTNQFARGVPREVIRVRAVWKKTPHLPTCTRPTTLLGGRTIQHCAFC